MSHVQAPACGLVAAGHAIRAGLRVGVRVGLELGPVRCAEQSVTGMQHSACIVAMND